MRHNARRNRNGKTNNNYSKKPSRTRVYDSNGPDVRIRGTAWQVTEKYQALAKDAEASGNWVLAESYHQHAEHYQRIINSFADDMAPNNASQDDSDDEATVDTNMASQSQEQSQQETVAA